jgi:transcriptional regulator with GAF, ATPase, and Fis domain
LGVKPEEIVGAFGKSLVPDTPEAQRRLREALESIGRGIDTSGVVLELRRKDDGSPLWIQWWSKPVLGGKYTRTMFVDITDRVLMEREQVRLQDQNAYLWEEIRREHNFCDIVGGSPGLRKVMQQIELVAPTYAAVLVTGESGTGKELVARAIHDHSSRKDSAFIKVNCSAVPESLFESEFFGHVRGAFTGALKDKPGRFELADGGTLFLDEIGEAPLAMQAKLLRVLQEQELERVGDTRTRKVDVRIIAATSRDLKKEVDAGRFREDLFYRLSVFPIQIPPLRERRDDIPPLAAHFVKQSARRMNRPTPRITQATIRQLTAHDWPGNVRELQNAVERAVILSQSGVLRFELAESIAIDAPLAPTHPLSKSALLTRDELKRQERDSIATALKQTGGKIFGPGGAAELLGMKPTTLASRIKALGLQRKIGV